MNDKRIETLDNDTEKLIMEIKKELPNLILPSMGMFDEVGCVDINGKDFVISNKEV